MYSMELITSVKGRIYENNNTKGKETNGKIL